MKNEKMNRAIEKNTLMDVEQVFRLLIKRFEVYVADRPGQTLKRVVRFEFMGAEPQQCRPVPFGFAADIVILGRHERSVLTVGPLVLILELPVLNTAFTSNVLPSRGNKWPLSTINIFFPARTILLATADPPAPDPTMMALYISWVIYTVLLFAGPG